MVARNSVRRPAVLAIGFVVVMAMGLIYPAGVSAAQGALIPPLQNAKVTSFDGTQINVNFYPAAGLTRGQVAPTVMEGSPWTLPALPGWLPTINSIGLGSFQLSVDMLGPATLTADGYNVVTWDARGWYGSGGQINGDNPNFEGRDVTAIINWLATLPGVELKAPNDPVVGMTGFSYGGGIQLTAASIDHRIDAIEPNASWYSLADSLLPNGVVKSGWGDILCLTGDAVGARYSPIMSTVCNSSFSGSYTQSEVAQSNVVGPGSMVSQITTPTLLLVGGEDTLFPINGDIATYEALKAAATPVKMMWYCGGHGICNQPLGAADHVANVELAFFDKYLKGENVSIGPGFEYLDQTGTWRSAASYPVPVSSQVTASGSGLLGISPFDTSGFLGIEATKAPNALNIKVPAPTTSGETLTDPVLSLSYQGVATSFNVPVVAQLVDSATGTVLDNQATAIPLVLDGSPHTLTLPLNAVVWNLNPSSRITLQLTDASDLFFPQQAFGLVHLQANLTLATSAPGPAS
jgi:ABC-2 type transport system ATP-binding protein